MNQWKLTDLIVTEIIFTDKSVKEQITDSISENLTDSDLESRKRACTVFIYYLVIMTYITNYKIL